MQTIGTPNNIDVLIHCHCSVGPHPRIDAPAVQKAIAELVAEGAIKGGAGVYRTTPKGSAWLQMLCETPPPRQVWADASGNIIKFNHTP